MNLEENKELSPQYIRTHKAISNALIILLKYKPFERITVQDILDETPVTRTTFYKHFHDKYEVAEYLQQQFFSLQREMISEMKANTISKYSAIIAKFFSHNTDLVKALYKINTDTVNIREINTLYHKDYFEKLTGISRSSSAAMVYAAAMNGFSEYTTELDYAKIDLRKEYNEAMIEAFLVLLSQNDNSALRAELYRLVNIDK